MSDQVLVSYAGPSGALIVVGDDGENIVIDRGGSAEVPRHLAESTVLSMPDHHLAIEEIPAVKADAAAPATKPSRGSRDSSGGAAKDETGSVSKDNLPESATPTTE